MLAVPQTEEPEWPPLQRCLSLLVPGGEQGPSSHARLSQPSPQPNWAIGFVCVITQISLNQHRKQVQPHLECGVPGSQRYPCKRLPFSIHHLTSA